MKKTAITLLVLIFCISFSMSQNLKQAAEEQKNRAAQEQQAAQEQKKREQQEAEEKKQREIQQQQIAAQEQRRLEELKPVVSSTSEGTLLKGSNLTTKLDWLERSVESHNTYIVEVNADENIAPRTLQYKGAINITVILRGDDENRTIRLNSHGSMFTVNQNVTFILDNNITILGHSGNTGAMVYVNGGILKMNSGSTITGNSSNTYQSCGGVYVRSGTFEMTGGTISNNASVGQAANNNQVGGGVSVCNVFGSAAANFIMSGGAITNNSAHFGGGVNVAGDFTMNGGTIAGNNATHGGGVYVNSGTFNMRGGTITRNIATSYAGGVYVGGRNSFTKAGGIITGYNSDQSDGNKVADEDGVIARRGHAVYMNENMRKESTADQGINLSSNNEANWGDAIAQTTTTSTSSTSSSSTEENIENDTPNVIPTTSSESVKGEPALMHIYRLRRLGSIIPKRYDILMDNTVVANSTNNWKTTVTVNTFGRKIISATIDGRKAEVSVNFEPGGIYYIRSDVSSKSVDTGRTRTITDRNGKTSTIKETEIQFTPILQLVDKSLGESEYNSIK